MLMTEKLFSMIDEIGYTWQDYVGDEMETNFDGTFAPATPEEIAVLEKFNCICGDEYFIKDLLEQNKEKEGQEWFNTAYSEFQKTP